ncbi:MAG TPA: Yip1 family protein [Pyrinomonadaceae bacterium]|jgi:hypothetical protein
MSDMNTPHAPAPSTSTPSDAPLMSTPETLSGIFFEPGRTFDALRWRPRFLIAAIIIIVAASAYTFLLYQRVGFEQMVRQVIENSPRTSEMPAEQREQMIAMQTGTVFKALAYVSPLIGVAIFLAVGAALYLLGAMAMGKGISYKQALSVYVYSSLPPAVLIMIANILLLFLKSPESLDPESAQRGLVHANLGILVDGAAHPVLATALGAFDIFAFYGLFLAAIGLRKVARLSSGSAWGIVLAIWFLGVLIRLALAAFSGSPMA